MIKKVDRGPSSQDSHKGSLESPCVYYEIYARLATSNVYAC